LVVDHEHAAVRVASQQADSPVDRMASGQPPDPGLMAIRSAVKAHARCRKEFVLMVSSSTRHLTRQVIACNKDKLPVKTRIQKGQPQSISGYATGPGSGTYLLDPSIDGHRRLRGNKAETSTMLPASSAGIFRWIAISTPSIVVGAALVSRAVLCRAGPSRGGRRVSSRQTQAGCRAGERSSPDLDGSSLTVNPETVIHLNRPVIGILVG